MGSEKAIYILLRAKDMASKVVKGLQKNVGGLSRTQAAISRGASLMGTAMIGAAGAAVTFGVVSVKAAGDFEAQLNTINTVAGLTQKELTNVGDGIRALARDSGTSLDDLTAAYYDLVSAGIASADAQGVLSAANTLAIGGLGTTAETVDLLTTALNSYGLKASEAGSIADMFAQSIAAGKVTASELAASFAQVGPIAANSGIEIRELAAGYALMTAQGVPATESATQMRSAIMALLKPTASLEKLQKKTHINFAKLAKEKGLVVALERMRVEAKKAGIPLTDLIGRVEGLNFVVSTTGGNLADYNKQLADVDGSAGLATKQMAERTKGFNFQVQKLGTLFRDIAITVGNKLLPKITPLIEKFAAFVGSNQPAIEEFGDQLAGAFQAAADFVKGIPWGSIKDALKIAGSGAKMMVDAFMAMPAEAKALIIGLAGLNKISGGAVSGIVGELGKGLIKGVLGMTAGVVNINAGVVNGGGLSTGGTGAGGGSALSSTIKGAARLILPFLPAAIAIGASEALQAQRKEALAGTGTAELKAMKDALVGRLDKGIGYMGARRKEADRQTIDMIDAELRNRGALEGTIGRIGTKTQSAINRGNSMLALVRAGVGNVAVGLGATKTTLNAALGTVRTAIGGVSTKTGMALTSLSRINTSTQGVRTAVANKKMAVTVNVKNSVSVRTFVEQARVRSTYDSNSSSGYIFR